MIRRASATSGRSARNLALAPGVQRVVDRQLKLELAMVVAEIR